MFLLLGVVEAWERSITYVDFSNRNSVRFDMLRCRFVCKKVVEGRQLLCAFQ